MQILKPKIYNCIIFSFSFLLCCTKINTRNSFSSLNIINASFNSNPVITNFSQLEPKGPATPLQYYATANSIPYGNSWESGSYVGSTNLSLSQSSDTSTSLWSGHLNLQSGYIYSLFIIGDTSNIDTLLITDNIPYYPASDSAIGIRFVNLVQNSYPMTVNIEGNMPDQIEFDNLGYKQISNFKRYSANSSIPGFYNFEIRDKNSDSLLITFSWFYSLQKSNTIVISGTPQFGLSVFPINNY